MTKKRIILLKTISWRIVGFLASFMIAWAITSDIKAGLSVGVAEFVIKTLLYYIHERKWHKIEERLKEKDNE